MRASAAASADGAASAATHAHGMRTRMQPQLKPHLRPGPRGAGSWTLRAPQGAIAPPSRRDLAAPNLQPPHPAPTRYADECIAISQYPLSGAAALGRLCSGYENHLGIL